LVIDDQDDVRAVTVRILRRLGFSSHEAASGMAGVELAARHATGLRAILLNLTMPQLSGYETLQRLHTVAPGVPVVLMSGAGEPEAPFACEQSLGEAMVHKPFTLDTLAAALRQVGAL
jgi:CheY-like chemotaxis protein